MSEVFLVEWDSFTSAILTEVGGKIVFKDIVEGENVREETDKVTGVSEGELQIIAVKYALSGEPR